MNEMIDTDGDLLVIGKEYIDHDNDLLKVLYVDNNEGYAEVEYLKLGPNFCQFVTWDSTDPVSFKKVNTGQKEETPGRKYDAGKPMYNLLPADALEEVVNVLTAGAIKYNEPIDQENWRLVANPQSRYFAAAQRHQWADQRGEYLDKGTEESPGTNCYHLACAITSLMFKLQLRIEEDRKAKEAKQTKGNHDKN